MLFHEEKKKKKKRLGRKKCFCLQKKGIEIYQVFGQIELEVLSPCFCLNLERSRELLEQISISVVSFLNTSSSQSYVTLISHLFHIYVRCDLKLKTRIAVVLP